MSETPKDSICFDCIKTRAFVATVISVITVCTIIITQMLGITLLDFPPNIQNIIGFIFGWSLVIGAILLLGYGSYVGICEYCDKSLISTYKDPTVIAICGLLLICCIAIMAGTIIYFEGNYNHWIVTYDTAILRSNTVYVSTCWNTLNDQNPNDNVYEQSPICGNEKQVSVDEYCSQNTSSKICLKEVEILIREIEILEGE